MIAIEYARTKRGSWNKQHNSEKNEGRVCTVPDEGQLSKDHKKFQIHPVGPNLYFVVPSSESSTLYLAKKKITFFSWGRKPHFTLAVHFPDAKKALDKGILKL